MRDRIQNHKGVLIVLLSTLLCLFFINMAFAQNCYEEKCVNGQCVIIPRHDLPGCDHPDETFSVSSSFAPTIEYYSEYPDVITFLQGYHEDFSTLINKLKKGEAFTDIESFAADMF